ncbi:MAG: hypothetical protein ACI9LG_002418 [Moritella dasanensis]|jgi:hypothetical protein
MKRNVISKKWMYFPIVSMLISTIIGLFIFNLTLSNWIEEKIEAGLASEITRITHKLQASDLPFNDLEKLNIYIKTDIELNHQNHITLVAFDGTVLADSDISLAEVMDLENHLNRKEIIDAKNNGHGTTTRFSTSRFKDLLYSANALSYKGENYILRVATPLTRIESMADELMAILVLLMTISLGLVTASTLPSSKLMNQQVQHEKDQQESLIEQRTLEIELLRRLTNMLAACNSIDEAQMIVEDIIPRILGDVNGVVSLIRSSRNQLLVKLDWGGA